MNLTRALLVCLALLLPVAVGHAQIIDEDSLLKAIGKDEAVTTTAAEPGAKKGQILHEMAIERMKSYDAGRFDVAVTRVTESVPLSEEMAPTPGQKFIAVYAYVYNGTQADYTVAPEYFSLVDSKDNASVCDPNTFSVAHRFLSADLTPGAIAKGWLLFQIPISEAPSKLLYAGADGQKVEKPLILTDESVPAA